MKKGKTCLFLVGFFVLTTAGAQKKEEVFDYSFKPVTTSGPHYYVTTEKKDSGWYREAYFITQASLAMKGWYKDEEAKIKHGPFVHYHFTRFTSSEGIYLNDKKEGVWLSYDEKGNLIDSSTYSAGKYNGVSLRWHSNGFLSDSMVFDGKGNGVHLSWYDDGAIASAGRWIEDTAKVGRWKYFNKDGSIWATEDYVNGKMIACSCTDVTGKVLDTALCKEKEAEPANGIRGWQIFLERGLQKMLEAKAISREWTPGKRSVMVRFVVEKDGSLSEFKALTQYGAGVEDEVIKLLRRSPRWTPGMQRGRPVRSYHTQPLTFVIQ